MAILFATALAQRGGASIHVLHVNEHVITDPRVTMLSRADATDLVTKAVEHMAQAGVRASGSVAVARHRHVPNRIAEFSRTRGADAIVLGSHRHHRFGGVFSARVRERTTRLTSLPLLTAPAPLEVSRGFELNDALAHASELELHHLLK
jgi:nucleotide-binding universal stress UspA family protein